MTYNQVTVTLDCGGCTKNKGIILALILPYLYLFLKRKSLEVHMHPIKYKAVFLVLIISFLSFNTLKAANNPPIIKPISDQMGYKPTDIIIDVEDPENDIISLSVDSSDFNVVPQSNLLLSGAGANWTLIITPAQIGSSSINVYANDNNGNEVSSSFNFQAYPIFKIPESVMILQGSFSVPLTLNNPSNEKIIGIDFTIDYDPMVLNATAFQLSETKLSDNYLMQYNTGISGQIIVSIASNSAVYTGTGHIGTLHFETITDNQSSFLSFSNARLNEWEGLTQNGTVIVLANQAPSISNIADVTTDEDTQTIVNFTVLDPESSPCSVTLDINSDNSSLLPSTHLISTCYNNTYTLVINPLENQYGSANITISATDSFDSTDTQNFTLEVISVNDTPQISSIDNLTIHEDTASNAISFQISDIETPASDLEVFADVSNTRLIPVENIILNGTDENRSLMIIPSQNQNGAAMLTITVSDSDKTASTSFEIIVLQVDDAPFVLSAIEDVVLNEDAPDLIIPLTNVFTDIDNLDDNIIKTVLKNTNTSLLSAIISGNDLVLSLQDNMSGVAAIEIQASSNSLTVVDLFTVTVTAEDDPLQVKSPIANIEVDEDAADMTIDLSSVFTDVDNDDNAIVKSITNISNPELVTASISNNTLTLSFGQNQNGDASITIRGTSNGKTVDDIFTVTVYPVDDAPYLNHEIEDVVVYESADDTLIPLTNIFIDIDNDPIIYSIDSNTNESLVATYIVDHTLILNYQPLRSGVAIITIRGMTNMLFEETSFIVTVIQTDSPPEISNPVNDITVNEGADNSIIPLTSVFSDPDNEDLKITKTIIENTNESLVVATIENNQLILYYLDDMFGSSTITIQGISNGKSITDSFHVLVEPVDTPPRVINPIHDLTIDEDAPSKTISLIGVFTDIDNDDSAISFNVANSNDTLLTISLQKNEMILTFLTNQFGETDISIQATSNGLTVVENFSVSVVSVNDNPTISNLIDLTTYESIPITQTFTLSDADNQDLTLTVTVSDTQLLPYDHIRFVGGAYIDENKYAIPESIPVEMQMNPASGRSGDVIISLTISDGFGGNAEKIFILTVKKYQINATAQGNGQIVPSGMVGVNTNTSSITFQIQPDNGYKIDYLIVDNRTISARPTYTFRNVAEDHSIKAMFREPSVYTISTQTNNGGNVNPNGSVQVIEETSQQFQIQSLTGFDIDYLMVDGNYVAATNEYIFNNVNESHNLAVFFKPVPAPVADFDVSVFSGTIPLVVSFTDKSMNAISSRMWEFGDGSSTTLKNPQHSYFEPGTYSVRLKVTGTGGEDTVIKNKLIHVYDLQIDYSAIPSSGAYPLTVTFTADMPDIVTHVVWSFGDGETSTHMSPDHTYKKAGEYTTQLTAYAGSTAVTIVKKEHIQVKGHNISGRITASDSGAGLSGYQVEVIQRQYNQTVGETYTDDNGYYTFLCEDSSVTCLTSLNKIPSATDLIVAVWPPAMSNDYYMQYYHGQSVLSKATLISTKNGDQSNIDISLERSLPLTISGKVHANGNPQIYTQVSAYSEKLAFGLNTLTDENGIYTLSGLKVSDDYRVYIWDNLQKSETYYAIPSNTMPGITIPTYSVYNWDAATLVEPKAGVLEHIDIVVDHSTNSRGMIQGQIQSDSHLKPENIWVYAFSEELNVGNGAFSDENGNYTITALSEVSDSDPLTMGYIVAVHSIQYKNQDENPSNIWFTYQAYPGVSDKRKAQHVRTGTTGIDFMLITQCQLTGTVMDIYHTPVPDSYISVSSQKAGMDFSSAVTDIDGHYAFTGLPPVNDYVVTVTAPNYPITYYKDQSKSENAEKIDLSNGNVGNINFKLDTGMVIRGTVYMDNINTPAPEGIWINIWSESTQTGGDEPTDINGRFQKAGLNPDANDYIISIRIKDYMPAFYRDNNDGDLFNDTVYLKGDAQGIAASSLQWAVDRNLLIRTGLSISGKILHNGRLYSGVEVEAFSEQGWDNDISEDSLTDGHNYKLSGLSPGEYNVIIKPSNFQNDSYRVELINEDVENILFPLKDLENSICGTVYGLAYNQNAQIIVWAKEKGYNHIGSLVGTGNPIDYTIPVKPSADYQIKFTAGNGYPDQWYNGQSSEDFANMITVSEGTVSGVDFHVTSGSQVISGTINFPESALAGEIVWVDAHSNSTGSNGSSEVMLLQGRTAAYQITGLKEAEDFIVVAWGKNYQEQYYENQSTEDNASLVNTADEISDNAINFNMNPGASISGFVYQDGIPATDLYVEAFSHRSSSFGGHTYIDDGSYVIEGLDLASDYIIKVYKSGMAPFYYHISGNTRDEKLATKVNTTENKHVSGINIHTYQLESISGTVSDEDGKSLSDIWVNVWSNLKKCGEGIYTAKDGSYKIDGLSKSDDYIVSIDEHADLIYVPEEKKDVKSNSSGVNFMLRKAFHLKGTVLDTSRAPIVKAQVELYSDIRDFNVWTNTDASGIFNIKCVPSANDYVLSVMPYDKDLSLTDDISFIKFNEAGLSIDAAHTTDNIIEKEIILKTGSYIIGHIYKPDGKTPFKNAKISVYSNSKGEESSGNAISNSEGYYQVSNIPISQDYIVTVTTQDYARSSKVDQSTGTSVDFILDVGGSISGRVIEEEGAPLADVLVGIISDTAPFSDSIRTDTHGNFIFTGLPRYLENGNAITNYVVRISPDHYPSQSQGQKQIGENLTFVCRKGEITGVITDSLGHPIPENVVVGIKAYKIMTQGGYETKTGTDADSHFVIQSLLFNTDYQLKVMIMGSSLENAVQWIDSNGLGLTGRNNAGIFRAGSHVSIQLEGTWNR